MNVYDYFISRIIMYYNTSTFFFTEDRKLLMTVQSSKACKKIVDIHTVTKCNIKFAFYTNATNIPILFAIAALFTLAPS